jgi:hypothetical protein
MGKEKFHVYLLGVCNWQRRKKYEVIRSTLTKKDECFECQGGTYRKIMGKKKRKTTKM